MITPLGFDAKAARRDYIPVQCVCVGCAKHGFGINSGKTPLRPNDPLADAAYWSDSRPMGAERRKPSTRPVINTKKAIPAKGRIRPSIYSALR